MTTTRSTKPGPKPVSPAGMFGLAVADLRAGHLDVSKLPRSLLREIRDLGDTLSVLKIGTPFEVASVQRALSAELARWAAEERDAFGGEIRRQIARVKNNVVAATVALDKAATYSIESQWSPVGDYLKAVAERDFWAAVEHIAETHDLLEAVSLYAEEVTKALIDNRYKPSSSDPTSRAALVFQGEAAAAFVRHYLVTTSARLLRTGTL